MVKRILIVDDEHSIVDVLSEHLTMQGHQCVGTGTPSQALSLLQSEEFNVLICDVSLPEMNGVFNVVAMS